MRWDGACGIGAYFRDYLYPLMDRITAPDGPFWAYDPPLKDDVPPIKRFKRSRHLGRPRSDRHSP